MKWPSHHVNAIRKSHPGMKLVPVRVFSCKLPLTVEVPSVNEKQNGGEVSHLDSTATNDNLPPVSPEPEPPVIDLLDHSSIECS